jgi:hypothetical protein
VAGFRGRKGEFIWTGRGMRSKMQISRGKQMEAEDFLLRGKY